MPFCVVGAGGGLVEDQRDRGPSGQRPVDGCQRFIAEDTEDAVLIGANAV